MEFKESKLGSIRTFLEIIPKLKDSDSNFFFRGHADKTYKILPSIYRKKEWFTNEEKMIREIIMRCPTEFNYLESSFDKLVKMQHYDLPTRLLDLTENPLVALYFACFGEDERDKDGEIIFFKIPKIKIKYYDSDTVSVLSNLAWCRLDFQISPCDSSFNKTNNPHSLDLLHNIKKEKPHFTDRIATNDIKSVICVKPKMENPRIIRQDGSFLIFGIQENKNESAKVPEEWIFRPEQKRYIIKAGDKQNLLEQLSGLGISKAKLFPEIDMVSQFIKNDYGLGFQEFTPTIKAPPKKKITLPKRYRS